MEIKGGKKITCKIMDQSKAIFILFLYHSNKKHTNTGEKKLTVLYLTESIYSVSRSVVLPVHIKAIRTNTFTFLCSVLEDTIGH